MSDLVISGKEDAILRHLHYKIDSISRTIKRTRTLQSSEKRDAAWGEIKKEIDQLKEAIHIFDFPRTSKTLTNHNIGV